jgi:hypothetical protein
MNNVTGRLEKIEDYNNNMNVDSDRFLLRGKKGFRDICIAGN